MKKKIKENQIQLLHLPHVLHAREHQLVIENPLRQLLEKRGGGVDVDVLALLDRAI